MIMRKLIALALAASVLTPVAASAATSRGELQRDRADIREETRDVRQAVRGGDPRAIRDEREDLREARREYREDRADWRDDHRGRGWDDRRAYQGPRFQAPFGYTPYRIGSFAPRPHYGARYWIDNPRHFALPYAAPGLKWVRHYDDALLVNMRTGQVRRIVRHVF
jgi:Ni/Co efflux regulator RcnB